MKIKKIFLCIMLCLMSCISVAAEEVIVENDENFESEVIEEDVQDIEEIREIIEYSFELSEPIKVFPITEEDYYQSENAARYVSGSAYQGSFNSTALNYFSGVMMNNLGKDYVAFRGSQYVYYLFFGDDIQYSGGRFVGSGLNYVSYSSYEGTFDRGTDDLSINPNNTVVYSNVDDSFANFLEVKSVEETRTNSIIIGSFMLMLLFFYVWKR